MTEEEKKAAEAEKKAEAKRLAAEKKEAERIAAEQAAAKQAEADRLAAEQAEAEQAEQLAAEQAEADRLAAEKAADEQAELDRLAAEQAATKEKTETNTGQIIEIFIPGEKEKKLREKCLKVLKDYPDAKEAYITSDGFVFFTKSDATNHAVSLDDKTVLTVPNS